MSEYDYFFFCFFMLYTQDTYFDDESAEVVISSLRLGDDQGSLLTNLDWFTFQDHSFSEDVNMNGNANANNSSGSSSSDDEVMVGEEEEEEEDDDVTEKQKDIISPEKLSTSENSDEPSEMQVTSSCLSPSIDVPMLEVEAEPVTANGSPTSGSRSPPPAPGVVKSLFEEDVEFMGVEAEGTEKAMDQALKEGIVGEAGPLKRNVVQKVAGNESQKENSGVKEFNDANFWRVDQEVAVLE